MLGGSNVYGIMLGSYTHGASCAEHVNLLSTAGHLAVVQCLVQFLGAVALNFNHCVFVTIASIICNAYILTTGEHVDLHDPVQALSNGYGVHRCIDIDNV